MARSSQKLQLFQAFSMSLLDQLSGLFNNVAGGNLSEEETQSHYSQIAQQVPQQSLGAAIGPALSSLGNDEVQQRIHNSAQQMNPEQKGGLVQSLFGALSGGGGGNLAGILSQLGISPSVASNPQSATPDEIAKMAGHAHATDPGLFEKATEFYSAHPTLVNALGTAVIAKVVGNLSRRS